MQVSSGGRMKRSGFLLLLALSFVSPSSAQTNLDEQQGFKPYESWHGGDLDSVSLTTGGLMLHVPLTSFPQRGTLDLNFSIIYNNKQWGIVTTCTRLTCTSKWEPTPRGGASLFKFAGNLPVQGALVLSSVDYWLQRTIDTSTPSYSRAIIGPDGSTHQFGTSYSVDMQFPARSLDASGMLLPDDNTLILPNGTRFSYANSVTTTGMQPSSITDPNGNQIAINSSGWTDTMGRLIPGSGTPAQPGVTTTDLSTCPSGTVSARNWDVPSVAVANGGATGTRRFKLCYSNFTIATSFGPAGQGAIDYGPTTNALLSAIMLPDGTMWTLSYDSYADVSRLGFPTGGSTSYQYGAGPFSCSGGSRWVTQRTVDANDGTGPHTWTYQYTQIAPINGYRAFQTTVTSPDGNATVHTISVPVAGAYCSMYDTQAQYYQGPATGTPIKTIATQYTGVQNYDDLSVANNVVATQVTVTWSGGHTSKVVSSYDSGNSFTELDANGAPYTLPVVLGSVLQKNDYDFSNALTRSTFNHYKWQDDATYKNSNFLSLPVYSLVKNPASCELAKTSSAYDETYLGIAVQSSGVSMQHVAPPGPVRGNYTSTSRWLITNCTEQSSITSHTIPYDTGLPYQSYDPLNHMTQYTYDASFYGAYLTQTNMPDTQNYSGGPVTHHIISGSYDFNTGLLTRFTDENSQNFTYTYDDMLRLKQGNHPDGGQTVFTYPDPNTVTRQELVTNTPSNVWDTFTAKFDGLGRTHQTQHSTPACTVLTDTTYDVVGRVATVSNPYCQGSSHQTDPTYGVTTTSYDALSRIMQTQKQDGSISSASYNDNCMTNTDEVGKRRTSCADALGRISTVFEDPSGLNYETDYQYDLLNNLTRVDQKGSAPGDSTKWRTRLFTYDSLSRLITASNPETGTICYGSWSGSTCLSGYDADGDLLTKTSPAANQPVGSTATTTSNFTYDTLNRVLTKVFTGNGYTETTPTATYGYDVPCCGVAQSNDIGRLAYATYGNTELVYQYDAMGRPKWIADCPPSGIQRGFCYGMGASYNQIGGIATLTYPDGSTTITYTPDSTGRLVSAIDSAHGINYVTGTIYNPAGMVAGMRNGASIANTYQYNQRLQICRITASTTGLTPGDCVTQGNTGNLMDLKYDFHIGNGTAGSGTDNGNVWTITNFKDANRTQTFTYDVLNRLSSAQNTGTNCNVMTANNKTEYWGNSYTYDAWGNLTNKTITKCSAENLSAAPAAISNQLPGYTYDVAGNMTNDAAHGYAYDAENRVTKIDTTTASYTYNALGHRVRKDVGSVATEYFYFGSEIIAELNPSTGAFTNYAYFNGQRVARRDSSGNVFYYLTNFTHSSSMVTDSAGTIKADSDYYPWGGELQIVNSDPNHYKFTGKERDSESQLDYFGARFYSSALGRFLEADPIVITGARQSDPQTLNLFKYGRNNPLKFLDPAGMADIDANLMRNVLNFTALNQPEVDKQAAKWVADYNAGKPAIYSGTPYSTGWWFKMGGHSGAGYQFERMKEQMLSDRKTSIVKQVRAWVYDKNTTAQQISAAAKTIEAHQAQGPDAAVANAVEKTGADHLPGTIGSIVNGVAKAAEGVLGSNNADHNIQQDVLGILNSSISEVDGVLVKNPPPIGTVTGTYYFKDGSVIEVTVEDGGDSDSDGQLMESPGANTYQGRHMRSPYPGP